MTEAEGIQKLTDYTFLVPENYRPGMRVPGIVYADEHLFAQAKKDRALEQVINVAHLPGIVKASLAMPDIHWGYGFPIGGVAATLTSSGVISPGGVGFDISCGVRLLKTSLEADEIRQDIEPLMQRLATIPRGVGSTGKIRLNRAQIEQLVGNGVSWAIKAGYGWNEDKEFTEEEGCMEEADPGKVSHRAFERGLDQSGTLGAGNHFLELQKVVEVYDTKIADIYGLSKGQLVVMIHSGSRGFGHQVCTDYLKVMDRAVKRLGISLPDRQLACAPVESPEGRDYLKAMACAANYALVNRHCLAHWTRQSFEQTFKKSAEQLGMYLLFDVSHNIARIEEHQWDGRKEMLCVHRKGATRAFGPGHPQVPEAYREVGQPVIIPGDMGSCSYVLAGTQKAVSETFGSTCHGAGRVMSRSKAKKTIRGDALKKELEERGIVVIAGRLSSLAEEAPDAYKDVSEVVEICEGAEISKKVAKLIPLAVVKG